MFRKLLLALSLFAGRLAGVNAGEQASFARGATLGPVSRAALLDKHTGVISLLLNGDCLSCSLVSRVLWVLNVSAALLFVLVLNLACAVLLTQFFGE